MLIIYAGAPIFLIMPMLIYGPKILLRFLQSPPESNPRQLLWHQRLPEHLLRRLGIFSASTAAEYRDQHRRLQKFSLYWEDRFVFAVLRWVSFIAFIAANTAIQATPSPGIACLGTDFVQDRSFTCYSEDLAIPHAVGSVIAVLICAVFPYYIFQNIRRISFNNREEDTREIELFGPFFGSYKKGLSQYFFLLNHFQMTVLIAVLGLVLSTDAQQLAVSNLVLNLMYILTVVIGRPFMYMLDNLLETATSAVQAFGILLQIVRLMDENAISDYTAQVSSLSPCVFVPVTSTSQWRITTVSFCMRVSVFADTDVREPGTNVHLHRN